MGITIRIILAFIITISAGIYQRKTGPTYPIDGEVNWMESNISYSLTRTHGGEGDQPVEVIVPDTTITAVLVYRHFKSDEAWTGMKMQRISEKLLAALPHQPPAGKLEYFIILHKSEQYLYLPQDKSAVTRFKGAVPDSVLIPHIFFMFAAMLVSTFAGLEALFNKKSKSLFKLTIVTSVLLFIGGMILGPVVQKFAFNEYWTGIPWGMDLTDNKTLIAMIAWIFALGTGLTKKRIKYWVVVASAILLLVYTIPHSVMGSELNYKTMRIETGK